MLNVEAYCFLNWFSQSSRAVPEMFGRQMCLECHVDQRV